MTRKIIVRLIGILILVALVGLPIWASDRITLQGERTIFTANCEGGKWEGNHCTGRLATGERYAFRASPLRNEVIHWIRGSASQSHKYGNCTVKDRDNWTCNVKPDEPRSITCIMAKGMPTGGCVGPDMPFHQIPKWKWWAMSIGMTFFTDAGT